MSRLYEIVKRSGLAFRARITICNISLTELEIKIIFGNAQKSNSVKIELYQ